MEKKTTTKKAARKVNFEKSFAELENIVALLEQGDLPLEDALKNFERGILLTQNCQKALTEAEQKVQILLQENQQESLNDFQHDNP